MIIIMPSAPSGSTSIGLSRRGADPGTPARSPHLEPEVSIDMGPLR